MWGSQDHWVSLPLLIWKTPQSILGTMLRFGRASSGQACMEALKKFCKIVQDDKIREYQCPKLCPLKVLLVVDFYTSWQSSTLCPNGLMNFLCCGWHEEFKKTSSKLLRWMNGGSGPTTTSPSSTRIIRSNGKMKGSISSIPKLEIRYYTLISELICLILGRS